MSQHLAQSDHDHALEINYKAATLEAKLASYGFKPSLVYSKLTPDQTQLNRLRSTEPLAQQDTYSEQLANCIESWPSKADAKRFAQHINQFIFLWLHAVQKNEATPYLLKLLYCLKIKSLWAKHTANFHAFLFDLIAEASQHYQRLTVNYLLHFDAATKLAFSNRLPDAANYLNHQPDERQIVAVFSLRFLSAKRHEAYTTLMHVELNQHIAARLTQQLGEHMHLYLSGAAQFDLLITHLTDALPLNLYAAKIIRAFEEMLLVNQHSVFLTPYIGCAYSGVQATSLAELQLNAKLALENAIDQQKNLVFYSDTLKQAIATQQQLETTVLDAFNSDNLTLFFQPIMDIKQLKCVGAELLLRWAIDNNQHVYPSTTIEILNKVGKGKLFTRWLVNSACRYVSELHNEHQMPLYLTLNLRAEDLYDIELPHLLTQAVKLWKINPDALILEITENGILEYNEHSNSVIAQLSAAGFKFALDDFGTGFSSLSRLRTMPINLIKIDQSFVRNIAQAKEDFEIVRSIASLAKSLGKEVLAEGVEDASCLAKIKAIEIDKCQGYFFGEAMSFTDFIAWAKTQ